MNIGFICLTISAIFLTSCSSLDNEDNSENKVGLSDGKISKVETHEWSDGLLPNKPEFLDTWTQIARADPNACLSNRVINAIHLDGDQPFSDVTMTDFDQYGRFSITEAVLKDSDAKVPAIRCEGKVKWIFEKEGKIRSTETVLKYIVFPDANRDMGIGWVREN